MNGITIEKNSNNKIYSMILIAVFTSLTCMGGFIRIPMFPVPFTLQTLFVYFSALLLGIRRAVLSQVLFLVIGLAGIPVFAKGGGPAYILQPSFGYLAAFPLSVYICGKIFSKNKNHSFSRLLLACASSMLVILGVGSLYLYFNLNYIIDTSVSFSKVFVTGFLVFLPAEVLKCFIAVLIYRKLEKIKIIDDLLQ